MTRSRQRVAQLRGIRDLRALSEHVAKAHAARSARASREQEERCRQDEALLDSALSDWRAALAEPRFDPIRAALHGHAVDLQDQARAQSVGELAELMERLDEARLQQRRAQASHRCATELLKQAERRHRRLRDERILAARDDGKACGETTAP